MSKCTGLTVDNPSFQHCTWPFFNYCPNDGSRCDSKICFRYDQPQIRTTASLWWVLGTLEYRSNLFILLVIFRIKTPLKLLQREVLGYMTLCVNNIAW